MSKSSDLDKKVKAYILDCINPEAYELEATTDAEKVQVLYNAFTVEYAHEIARKGQMRALAGYYAGLPSICNIDFENCKILELAVEWDSIPKNATEKQEDKILENWWLFIANKTLQLFRKHKTA